MSEEIKQKSIAVVNARSNTFKGVGAATGIRVQPGQTLSTWVDDDETWELGAGRSFGANGNAAKTVPHPTSGQFEYSDGGLVGSLDGGKTFFPVGTRLLMSVPVTGDLTLYAWDDGPDSNTGEIEVVIGVQDYEDDDIRAARARAAKWGSFLVKSDEHFTGGGKGLDTGVKVTHGDVLRVVVSGADVWSAAGSAGLCSASGYGFFEGKPMPVQVGSPTKLTFPRGALVGSLDGGKTFFFVGNQLELTALGAGRLVLYCADNDLSDNDPNLPPSKRSLTAYVNVVASNSYRGLLSR